MDWNLTPERRSLLDFVRRLIRLRRDHPVFHRRRFFEGRPIHGSGIKDIVWLKPDGAEMSEAEWRQEFARSLGMLLNGESLTEVDPRGRRVTDGTFLVLFNAHHEEIAFVLPNHAAGLRWLVVLDTTHEHGLARGGVLDGGAAYALSGRSLALLQEQRVVP